MSKRSGFQNNNTAILRASLFLGAFALLESSIVKAVEFFYQVSDPSGDPWKRYIQEVMIYSDDTFESLCIWLEKNKVIKHGQFSSLMTIKRRRDWMYQNFNLLALQDIGGGAGDTENTGSDFTLEKKDFEEMTDLFHRVEVWRSAVDYGLEYTGEEEDLEAIFPISVIGMIRMTTLAFPDTSIENQEQE
jgi:hypothetical protein